MIKRWEPMCFPDLFNEREIASMEEDEDGGYVRYEDYKEVERKLEAAQRVLDVVGWTEPAVEQSPFDRGYNLAMSQINHALTVGHKGEEE